MWRRGSPARRRDWLLVLDVFAPESSLSPRSKHVSGIFTFIYHVKTPKFGLLVFTMASLARE
jgi:hypothetical protein